MGAHAHGHGGPVGPAGHLDSPVHRLDPRAKLIGLLGVTVVAVSVPGPSGWPVWAGCAVLLMGVAALGRVPPGVIWRRSRIVLPLVLLAAAAIPFVHEGGRVYDLGPVDVSGAGLALLAGVAAKAAIGTLAAVLLGATTSFPAVVNGLEALRVPRLLTLVASLMYRYLFVLAGELGRMRAALAARGHRPRHLLHSAAAGRLAAALFLRSVARGERVQQAMAARGYQGTMPRTAVLRLVRADAVFVALVVAVLAPLRVVAG